MEEPDTTENTTAVKQNPTNVEDTQRFQSALSNGRKGPRVLYVADDIGHDVNLDTVEKSQKCRISSAHAYTSVYAPTRFPAKNFHDVVYSNLKRRDNYEVLVMSAPTEDITNSVSRAEVIDSCKNMIHIAEKSLKENKHLKKVVIMEHHPRFDSKHYEKQVIVANETIEKLVSRSTLKDRIMIGRHSLFSYGIGKTHMKRYQNQTTGRYDGLHLFGPTGIEEYTQSVESIFFLALSEASDVPVETKDDLSSEWKTVSGRTRIQTESDQVQITTTNRFSSLGQGN